MTAPRPESEIYRDGFRDAMASARRAVQLIEDTFQDLGVPYEHEGRAALRGIADAFEWVRDSPNIDQAIAHWRALQVQEAKGT